MDKNEREVSVSELLGAARTYATLMLILGIVVSLIVSR